jgi:low temperature requirement protein LtrA
MKQRQKWGEDSHVGHVDWMDLFQDLFFVGAAYNLSHVLIENHASFNSLVYFTAYFLHTYKMWSHKVDYDCRYAPGNHGDLAHKLYDVSMMVWTLGAILHIRPSEYLLEHVQAAWWFTTMIMIYNLGAAMRYLEIVYYGDPDNDAGARVHANLMAKSHLATVAVFIASLVVLIVVKMDDVVTWNVYVWLGTGICDRLFRVVAVANSGTDHHVESEKLARQKATTVPMNVEMLMHRIGEFTMLCLGEGVLSVAISTLDYTYDFYATVMGSLLLLIMLQFLFYSSQPHGAEGHAMRRDKDAGVAWALLTEAVAAAFITVGAGLKLVLETMAEPSEHRRLGGYDSEPSTNHTGDGDGHGEEAEGVSKQQAIVVVAWSLIVSYIAVDMSTMLHKGFGRNVRDLWHHRGTVNGKYRLMVLLLKAVSVAATWISPSFLSFPVIFLVGIVVSQVFLKRVERILRAQPDAMKREDADHNAHVKRKLTRKMTRNEGRSSEMESVASADGNAPYVQMHDN